VRHAVAIENGQVHQRVVENVDDDRGEMIFPREERISHQAAYGGCPFPQSGTRSQTQPVSVSIVPGSLAALA
jgi:hypothetical protein